MNEMDSHGKDCLCRQAVIGCANIHDGTCEDCEPSDCATCGMTVPRCSLSADLTCQRCMKGGDDNA